MATPTYDPIASTTLTSSASSVTFSSLDTIAAGYRDLVLVMDNAKNSVATTGSIMVRFNSDTGSNYSYVYAVGYSTSNFESGSSTNNAIYTSRVQNDASTPVWGLVNVMDYSATDKHKSVLFRANSQGTSSISGAEMIAGRWANTSAVNTIVILTRFGGFAAGSTFSLYGIVA